MDTNRDPTEVLVRRLIRVSLVNKYGVYTGLVDDTRSMSC